MASGKCTCLVLTAELLWEVVVLIPSIAVACCRLASLPASEFAAGVEELSKAKLEKPKRLGELARRWWWEIYSNTWCFDRPVRGQVRDVCTRKGSRHQEG